MKHIFSVISILSLTIACGGADGSDTANFESVDMDAAVCIPGSSQACVGPGGCEGGQTCNEDGTAFDVCDCGDSENTAGSGGNPPEGDAGSDAGGSSNGGSDSGMPSGGSDSGLAGAGGTSGSDAGGMPNGGNDAGGSGAGGTGIDSGPDCEPKSCATLTVELSGNTSGDFDSCGLIEDGCGGYVECGGCADKTPFDDVYASCGSARLCESTCFVADLPDVCDNLYYPIACSQSNWTPPRPGCEFKTSRFSLELWCCPKN